MKISIVTSCFNRVQTIRACMQSVMQQVYPDVEYIVVDGASTDGTWEVVREMELYAKSEEFGREHPRFSMKVLSEPDHGMYEAINKGIRMATGDYIGLVHSDDFLFAKQTIARVAERLERTKADFLYGDGLFVDFNNTDKVVRNWIGGRHSVWKVKNGWLPLHPTCYMKRQVMMERGLYDESYKIAADSDLLFRYLLKGDLKVTYLKEYIVRMRMGGLSTDSAKRRQMWNEDIRLLRANGFVFPRIAKMEKMMWKVPQFVKAKLMGATVG